MRRCLPRCGRAARNPERSDAIGEWPNNPSCLVGIEGGVIVSFSNVYDDTERAKAYAALEFPGTYYLAYRDLPAIISQYVAQHVSGREALDLAAAPAAPPGS